MKELEYQDIALYLPDLQVQLKPEYIQSLSRPKFEDRREYDLLNILTVEFLKTGPLFQVTHPKKEWTEYAELSDFWPALYDWESLGKERDVDGKKIIPLVEIAKIRVNKELPDKDWVEFEVDLLHSSPIVRCYFVEEYKGRSGLRCGKEISYSPKTEPSFIELQYLSKLQIDCNDLIGQGLAVNSINYED